MAYAWAAAPQPGRREEPACVPNRTGLPDPLKAGAESLSGMSLDDVRVHYNSPQPAHYGAQAFTRGSEIHVGPGAERHLAHEAWHVVQQKQRRVAADASVRGVPLNTDRRLENEADTMGARALRTAPPAQAARMETATPALAVTQCYGVYSGDKKGDTWTVSDNDNMALRSVGYECRELYATPQLIAAANQALRQRGSFVRLIQGPPCPHPSLGALYRAYPSWVPRDQASNDELGKAKDCRDMTEKAEKNRLANNRGGEPNFAMWADCSKAAQAVIGGRMGYFRDFMVKAGKTSRPQDEVENKPSAFARHLGTSLFRAGFGTKDKARDLRARYADLADEEREAFDRQMGINLHASPDVGEAYLIATESTMPGYRPDPSNEWIYHVAGVVMSDGSDRVTLEGFSLGADSANAASNNVWNFEMHGTDPNRPEQTFHDLHLNQRGQHANRATTMVIHGPGPTQSRPGRTLVRAPSTATSTGLRASRLTTNVQRPTLGTGTTSSRQPPGGTPVTGTLRRTVLPSLTQTSRPNQNQPTPSTGQNRQGQSGPQPQRSRQVGEQRVPAYVAPGLRVREVSGAGYNCAIRALLLAGNGSVDETVVAQARRMLVSARLASAHNMLSLRSPAGRRLIQYLHQNGRIDATRGIRVYYYMGDGIAHEDVVDGPDPISVYLSFRLRHYYAVVPE